MFKMLHRYFGYKKQKKLTMVIADPKPQEAV
jgi:hypothetical protein